MKIQTRNDIQKISIGDYLKVCSQTPTLADQMLIIRVSEVDHSSLTEPQVRGEVLLYPTHNIGWGKFITVSLLEKDLITEIITYDEFIAAKLSVMRFQ
jgi:hypothetical protein